jgi:hypothetical protein
MKSTWEEKARISKDHERDRARLEREQQESQKLLAKQREDSWRLLETKGDLELSISHVKDLLRVVQPDGGTDRISSWMVELREILKLEAELSEQYTVVDVYQSSLLRDSEAALKDKVPFLSPFLSFLHLTSPPDRKFPPTSWRTRWSWGNGSSCETNTK